MLYELIGIVRPGNLAEVKDIVRTTGTIILRSGGTIRSITNWGTFTLPQRARRHQQNYTEGQHFVLRYDSNSATQDNIQRMLGLDPRIVRWATVKLDKGDLPSLAKWGSKIPWSEREV